MNINKIINTPILTICKMKPTTTQQKMNKICLMKINLSKLINKILNLDKDFNQPMMKITSEQQILIWVSIKKNNKIIEHNILNIFGRNCKIIINIKRI